MIRVNLLPVQEARRRQAGRWQLGVFGVVLLAELGACVALYVYEYREVEAIQKEVAEVEKKVEDLKERVEETRKFEKKHEKLKQKKETLEKIQSESIGPGPLLKELQVLLTEAQNMEQRYAQREKGWNVEWDPTNLWIKSLEESNRKFTLNGRAVDADDVAEFLHRLETASHFHDVKLDYVRPSEQSEETSLVEFRVKGTVTYRAKRGKDGTKAGESSGEKGGKGS